MPQEAIRPIHFFTFGKPNPESRGNLYKVELLSTSPENPKENKVKVLAVMNPGSFEPGFVANLYGVKIFQGTKDMDFTPRPKAWQANIQEIVPPNDEIFKKTWLQEIETILEITEIRTNKNR